jgi:predicted nucleic acid-binding protein
VEAAKNKVPGPAAAPVRESAAPAAALASRYKLRAADATHLATAVSLGADRFITSNSRDLTADIAGITVTYPADLPDPAG